MALPVLKQKVFKTNLISNGKEISFRPFSIGEQKMLMLAKDNAGDNNGKYLESLIEVMSGCVDGVGLRDVYVVDLQRLFYDIRSVASGNVVDFTMRCKTPTCTYKDKDGAMVPKTSDQRLNVLADLVCMNDGNFATQIELPDEKIFVNLEQPKVKDAIRVQKMQGLSTSELTFAMIPYMLKSIVQGEQVFTDFTIDEATEFMNSINDPVVMQKLTEYFKDSPYLMVNKTFKCPHCGNENEMTREDVQSFFT